MILFFKKQKTKSKKQKAYRLNRGFTYVELIVVLSIFAIMSSIAIFNYGKFQAKVDIRNLANDIALQIVQAQKDAMSGKWNINALTGWKPSYGVYFDIANKYNFIYFADFLDVNQKYDSGTNSCNTSGSECLENINITKGNFIQKIGYFSGSSGSKITTPVDITFTRPNSGAVFYFDNAIQSSVSYIQITIASPQGVSSNIKIYSSGRVQIN